MTTGFMANFDTTFVSMANNTNIFLGNKTQTFNIAKCISNAWKI